MILFLSYFPKAAESKDGMAQRIIIVDDLLKEFQRIYIYLTLWGYWIPDIQQDGSRKSIRAHALTGIPILIYYAVKCKIVYIHSIHNAVWTIYIIPFVRFILDFHGVVPEEVALSGSPTRAYVFGIIESICVRMANRVICVSRQMESHLAAKYPRTRLHTLLLPVLNQVQEAADEAMAGKAVDCVDRVIYSGGMQPWQNIDKMLEAMAVSPINCRYEMHRRLSRSRFPGSTVPASPVRIPVA